MKKEFILYEPCCPNCDSMDANIKISERYLIPIFQHSEFSLGYVCPCCGEIIYLGKEKINEIPSEVINRIIRNNKECANELIQLFRLRVELRSLKNTYDELDKKCKKLQKSINNTQKQSKI